MIQRILMLVMVLTWFVTSDSRPLFAESAKEIDEHSAAALAQVYAQHPKAKELGQNAKGILIFPKIVKGGFIVGGQGGDGSLQKAGKTVAYYRSAAGSIGLQAGVQWFGYVMFFMDDDSLKYLDSSKGWEVGTGPSVVVLDEGAGKSATTTTLKKGVNAIIFGQKGLMAGISLEGSKITKITPDK